MASEVPMAMIAKWISNMEQHEKGLLARLANAARRVEELDNMLKATRSWLVKFRDMQNILEGSNQESVEILNRDADAVLKNELGTHFSRIRAFLMSQKNEPQTIAEIEQGTKIPRTSISAVVYRTHADHFVDTYVANKRGKVWSLNPTTDEEAAPDFPPGFNPGDMPPSDSDYRPSSDGEPIPPPPGPDDIPF